MSVVTNLRPQGRGAEIVDKMIEGGGALRRHPPHPAGPPKGIVKDGHNLYKARVASNDPQYTAHVDLAMRVNAMENSFNHVLREVQKIQARAPDPYAPAYVPGGSNVIPMKARSRASQAVSQPGNEARPLNEGEEATVFELHADQGPLLKPANSVPEHIPQLHGSDIHPPEVVERLSHISDEHPDRVADVAWRHRMDLVELTDIAYAVYTKREMSCYDIYSAPRDEVSFNRLMSQFGIDTRPGKNGPHVYHKSVESKFSVWAREIQVCEDYLRLVSNEKLADVSSTHTRVHPLVPGEVTARQRANACLKDEVRHRIAVLRGSAPRRVKFHEIGKVSRRLKVGHHVTTSSQIAGFSSAFRAIVNAVGKAHGTNQRKVGMRKKRLMYTQEARANDPNEFPSVKLGYWTKQWWELPKSHTRGQTDRVWVPNWKTVRTTTRTTERWHDPAGRNLETMSSLARMRLISKRLVETGLNDPDHVESMEGHLLRHYGETLLHPEYVVGKNEQPGMRRSRRCVTDE